MIREVLLVVFAAAWLVVIVITALRVGEIPPQLWAVLPFGIGAIMAAFRADGMITKRDSDHQHTGDGP